MPKPKLPGRLKALLALHGVCAMFSLALCTGIMITSKIWGKGFPFPILSWWSRTPEQLAENFSGDDGMYAWTYKDDFYISLAEFVGFLLLFAFLAFLVLFLRRKKIYLVPLCTTTLLELTMVIVTVTFFTVIQAGIVYWMVLLLLLLPFAAALVVSCFSAKPIKAYLEAKK